MVLGDLLALSGLRQPDRTSCGPSTVVAARMLSDPAFARSVHRLGWAAEVRATHRRVTGLVAADGGLQPPWPRRLGTPPWALARELSSWGGPCRARLIRRSRTRQLPAVARAVDAGWPVPLYVGDRWLPRHVVLVVAQRPGRLRVYEPAGGDLVTVGHDDLVGATMSLAGWHTPWFVVLPSIARPRRG